MLHYAFVLCATLPVGAASSSSSDTQVNAAKTKRLVVHAEQGDIHVRAVRDTHVKVVPHNFAGSENCKATPVVEDKAVTVQVTGGAVNPCHTDLDIAVPTQFDLDITVVQGTVYTSGTRGAVTLHLRQGNAVLGGHISGLDATLEAGSMSANGLSGDTTINLDAGNAQLWYESGKGNVDVTVKRGNVTITAPVTQASINTNLLKGNLQASMATGAGAAFSVGGTIEQGNLTVRGK